MVLSKSSYIYQLCKLWLSVLLGDVERVVDACIEVQLAFDVRQNHGKCLLMRYEDTRSSNAMHKYEGRVTTLLRIIAL